jgi:propanediol dehydratase small subunit
MTNIIKIGFCALSAVVCLAGAAQAQEVRINLAGKSPDTVKTEIERAANRVCAIASADELVDRQGATAHCVDDTVSKAQADYARSSTRMAMAQADERAAPR